MQPKIVKSDCRTCARSTRHEISNEVEDRIEDWATHELTTWRIVRCLGCHTYSFQHMHENFDEIYEDVDGEMHHSVHHDVYPSVVKNHRGLTHTYLLPPLISTIYQQTVQALSRNANILGSIGLRGCIEATCNNLSISGSNLERRIDLLAKGGYVSNGDKKRLHAIRFLGNDAAHEIKQPSITDIRVALEVVEHLLNSVYILEKRTAGMETIVESYAEFLVLLERRATWHKSGASINLLGLLGKTRRLLPAGLDSFETQLMKDIDSGSIVFLSKSLPQKIEGKEIHFYDVNIEYFKKKQEDDDDIPF